MRLPYVLFLAPMLAVACSVADQNQDQTQDAIKREPVSSAVADLSSPHDLAWLESGTTIRRYLYPTDELPRSANIEGPTRPVRGEAEFALSSDSVVRLNLPPKDFAHASINLSGILRNGARPVVCSVDATSVGRCVSGEEHGADFYFEALFAGTENVVAVLVAFEPHVAALRSGRTSKSVATAPRPTMFVNAEWRIPKGNVVLPVRPRQ